ncbi:MAG: response regulator [Deltaproteobacteria bacterium]|nr:response regulator [Deltaproteobacteria bacterium]
MGEAVEQLNVLIIEDEPDMRRLLVDLVSRGNHVAVPAESAEEGLSLLPNWTFQLAFLDHNLPGMEGLLLGEYLRDNNPEMTIALVTGSDEPKLERRTRDLRITFVPKPFELERIDQIIRECVAQLEAKDEQRKHQTDEDFHPPIARYAEELAEIYAIPNVPSRVQRRLEQTIKRALMDLRSRARYSERQRVVALTGLIAARVLDVDLPRTNDGLTLYEEYDRYMKEHGRRTEFE